MTAVTLDADCARCAALCCVGLAFDRSALFGFDKPAGEPCRNLDPGGQCRIHADLETSGFAGCVRFDCAGAGQYVTQVLFGGRSWRDDPALLAPMMSALSVIKPAHELLVLLEQAEALALPSATRETLRAYRRRLTPARGWTRQDVASGMIHAIVTEARTFLESLRPFVSDRRAG